MRAKAERVDGDVLRLEKEAEAEYLAQEQV